MPSSLPHTPDGIGIAVVDVQTTETGWTVGVAVPGDLHGPTGILQGGLSAALPRIVAADLLDRHGALAGFTSADITTTHSQLRRPTPIRALLHADVTVETGTTDLDVVVRNGQDVTVRGTVEVAGPPPVPLIADLGELAALPSPDSEPRTEYPDCFVCGSQNPRGLRILPQTLGETGRCLNDFVPDERVDDGTGHVHPVAASAVLDCPGVWAGLTGIGADVTSTYALLADYRVQVFEDVPIGEPARTVGLVDDVQGRQLRVRTGLYDDEGRLRAMASAMHVLADALPPAPDPATPI